CATKYAIRVYHPAGTLVASKELTAGNATWKTSFKEPGDYFIKAEAFNAAGVASTNNCEDKVYINYPPVCDLKVSPVRGYTGKPFKLDATGSTDKDGKVVKADFAITDKDGKAIDQKATDSLDWDKIFKKSGIYNVSLKVTDDFNAVSKNTCEATLEVQKRFYLVAEAGPGVSKGTYSGMAFARLGFAYLLNPEKLSVLVNAGASFNLAGEPFKTHFMSSALLIGHFNKFYAGAGVGFSTEVRPGWDSDVDIVLNMGLDVMESFNKKGSIFTELRIPMQKDVSFSDAHQIMVGFRYLF
ncbi:MAG: hypothetical protein GY757_22500, partial [bacterium]|nr:hypothetical protein [bacterium]